MKTERMETYKIKSVMTGIKKMTKWLLAVCVMATMGCSEEDMPEPVDWKVYCTQSGGKEITVALRYDGIVSYARLIPSEDETLPATWVDGKQPVWPADNTTPVEVIAFYPAVDELPVTVDATENIAYKMDYIAATKENVPTTFNLTHLMGELKVHIKLQDVAEHHFEPKDATIGLYTTATVDYPNKCLINPANMNEAFSLGTFSEDGNNNTATAENWANESQIVIPQTLEAGKPCLTFKAGDQTITHTLKTDQVLKAGTRNKLYISKEYQNENVDLEGVNVTNPTDGGSIDGGLAEESREN